MKKITNYLTSHPVIHAFIAMGENLLFWILFIVFNFLYQGSVDWEGYNEAIKVNPDVALSNFFNDATMIYYFIGFLFLVLGLVFSIYVIYRWCHFGYIKLKEKADE